MFFINITFAEENTNLKPVTDWLKEVGCPIASNSKSGVIGARLMKIVGVPGDPDFLKEGTNLSMQLEFESRKTADEWMEDYFSPLLDAYSAMFERNALCFATILEQI